MSPTVRLGEHIDTRGSRDCEQKVYPELPELVKNALLCFLFRAVHKIVQVQRSSFLEFPAIERQTLRGIPFGNPLLHSMDDSGGLGSHDSVGISRATRKRSCEKDTVSRFRVVSFQSPTRTQKLTPSVQTEISRFPSRL